MVVGCPSIFNKLNRPLAKLPCKKFYKEMHKDIYLNLSVMWASVSQILQELRFAQILVCVSLELCLILCQTKNYSNVCSWECVFCSCWFPAHTPPSLQSSSNSVDELPFPFSTLTLMFSSGQCGYLCCQARWCSCTASCQCLPAVSHGEPWLRKYTCTQSLI